MKFAIYIFLLGFMLTSCNDADPTICENYLECEIINVQPPNAYINIGSHHGLKKDDLLFFGERILIATDIYRFTAKVSYSHLVKVGEQFKKPK